MVVNTFSKNLQKFGLGDFIRGSYGLYEICRNLNIDFAIDLSDHPIIDYIIPKIDIANKKKTEIYDISSRKDAKQIAHYIDRLHSLYNSKGYEYIRFYSDIKPIGENKMYNYNLREYFLPNQKSNELIKSNFEYDSYNLIHIRCGDHNVFGGYNINDKDYNVSNMSNIRQSDVNYIDNIIATISTQLSEIKTKSTLPILVISDSYLLKKKLSAIYDFHIIDNDASHTIEYTDFFNEIALDFFLTCRAQSIHQFCIYKRPSGFSYWPHILFDIPFYYYNTISTFEE